MLPGTEHHLFSTDTPENEGQLSNYPVEFLNNFNIPSLPDHGLILKKNTVIMLMRNINLNEGLSNGTRLYITNIDQHVIEAQIITGKNIGKHVP